MPQVRLSVVIPFRDRVRLIPRCLASLQALLDWDCEILFVDNASTDASRALVEGWIREREGCRAQLRLISCERVGSGAARNAGAAEATGTYLFFFDSDDELEAQFLTLAADYLDAHPLCDLFCARGRMVFADGRERVRRSLFTADAGDEILSAQMCTVTALMRREWLAKCGGWDERLTTWDDVEFYTRLLLHAPRVAWCRRGAFHRLYVHGESNTGTSFRATLPAIRLALGVLADDLAEEFPAVSVRAMRRARRALSFRHAILSELLRREGAAAEADAIYKTACMLPGASPWRLELVRMYTRCLRVGAWRVARALL